MVGIIDPPVFSRHSAKETTLKRTRRVEVIRYSRRVRAHEEGLTPDIDAMLALAVRPASIVESKNVTPPVQIVEPELSWGSRLRRALRLFKKK